MKRALVVVLLVGCARAPAPDAGYVRDAWALQSPGWWAALAQVPPEAWVGCGTRRNCGVWVEARELAPGARVFLQSWSRTEGDEFAGLTLEEFPPSGRRWRRLPSGRWSDSTPAEEEIIRWWLDGGSP